MIEDVVEIAKQIQSDRYCQAEVMFLAGSVARGEGTSNSDLDLVVVFSRLPNAYRESFRWQGWPVEAFVHDPETIRYFFRDVDCASGVPSLPAMVSEGIELPEPNEVSRSLKALADSMLAEGPPRWGKREIDSSRYAITDLLDDLYDPRSRAEELATGAVLFSLVANHFLRARQLWSAKGKTITRRLREVDADFAIRYEQSFQDLFVTGDTGAVTALADEVLEPHGGRLFEGYILAAPREWRRE